MKVKMLIHIFVAVSLLSAGAHGQLFDQLFGPSFPFGMTGFDPSRFAAQMQAQMQGLSFGLQNMGANIQRTVADSIRRAQESGNFIDTSDLQPGEFRRFTDRDGNPTGFAFRSADGQSVSFSSGTGGHGTFFSNGPNDPPEKEKKI